MRVAFVLLLNDAVASQCESLSASFALNYHSSYVLGGSSLPHITVLQTECEEGEVESIWLRARGLFQPKYSLTFAGLTLLPSSSGRVWIEVQVLKTEALVRLQDSLLAIDILKHRKVLNGLGDNYRPHVTVGLVDQGILQGTPLPQTLLRSSGATGVPSFGELGENYVYTRPLFTVD